MLGWRFGAQNFFNSTQPGQRGDWKEVEGCYVLYPPAGRAPRAVAHFLGDAFVGAAPQVAYRLFLEALSNRDVLVSVNGARPRMLGRAASVYPPLRAHMAHMQPTKLGAHPRARPARAHGAGRFAVRAGTSRPHNGAWFCVRV